MDDDWAKDYLKALKIRGDMIEKYGSIQGWFDHMDEYKQRMATEEAPSLDETDFLVARIERLAAGG